MRKLTHLRKYAGYTDKVDKINNLVDQQNETLEEIRLIKSHLRVNKSFAKKKK